MNEKVSKGKYVPRVGRKEEKRGGEEEEERLIKQDEEKFNKADLRQPKKKKKISVLPFFNRG